MVIIYPISSLERKKKMKKEKGREKQSNKKHHIVRDEGLFANSQFCLRMISVNYETILSHASRVMNYKSQCSTAL